MTSDAHVTGALPVPPDIGPPQPPPGTSTGGGKAADVKDSAKQQAAQVGSTATDAAGATASTAKEQIGNVAQEAAGQAKDLWSQASSDINDQATQQTQRLTSNIRQLAEHLTGMADNGESGSPAQSLVREAGKRAHGVADYLDGRQPGDFVTDIQQFGRRRPGTFLIGAAAAGFLAGRLIKAAKNAEQSPDGQAGHAGSPGSFGSSDAAAIDLRGESATLPPTMSPTLPPAVPGDALSMPAGGESR
jgi:hypothetical protein